MTARQWLHLLKLVSGPDGNGSIRVSCRIEKRTGGEFRTLERFSVSQTRTPSKDNPLSGEKLARTIYDVSLDQLVRKLKSLPPFAGP